VEEPSGNVDNGNHDRMTAKERLKNILLSTKLGPVSIETSGGVQASFYRRVGFLAQESLIAPMERATIEASQNN